MDEFYHSIFQTKPALSQGDISSFFTRLMIYYLCRLFNGTSVDGTHFQELEFNNIEKSLGTQPKFNNWKSNFLQYRAEDMIKEYIRLINIAFKVNCDSPPTFLLDNIQHLCKPTTIESKYEFGELTFHSFLSLLLLQMSTKFKPACICTGTENGNIHRLIDGSRLIPNLLKLE